VNEDDIYSCIGCHNKKAGGDAYEIDELKGKCFRKSPLRIPTREKEQQKGAGFVKQSSQR
jgi:hypothetical protein